MSQTSPTEPDQQAPEEEPAQTPPAAKADAPLSYVPHDADGAIPREPVRFRSARYGEMEEHELIRLLDTIEDERARSRFRESVYISCFIWLIIVWVGFYGPRYLWHAPRVIDPMNVLKQREITQLNFSPSSPHVSAPPRPAAPPPPVDTKTLERLRAMTKSARTPTPNLPNAPEPVKVAPTPSNPTPNIPPPTAPTPNVRTPPPVVAEAPSPQPTTKPNFNTGSASAGESIKNALDNAAHDRGGGSMRGTYGSGNQPLKMGGAEILSDTQNVNFNPYLQRLLADIYHNWLPLIPEEARPPLSKQGETLVRFKILPDGTIGGMWLDGSTHDDAINHSAWSSITSEGQFPPLPSQFHGPDLELRIHFLVNTRQE